MNIEITKLPDGLTVSESVIRDVLVMEDGTPHVAPHFQGVLRFDGANPPSHIHCDVMYYDKNNTFLGHDSWGDYARIEWRGDVYPLDMTLTVPKGAATVRLSLSVPRRSRFWPGVGKALVVLLLALILALIWRALSS